MADKGFTSRRLHETRTTMLGDDKQDAFLSVSEVLEILEDDGYTLLAGGSGLHNRCRNMIVLETPDGIDWLTGDEFVLTAGYALPKDTEGLVRVVRDAHRQGIAALAIKEKRFLPEFPEAMIAAADELGVPLIQLPANAIYTEKTARFYNRLFFKQNASLVRARNIDNRLLSLVFDQGDTDEFIVGLSGLLGLSVGVFDTTMEEMSNCYTDTVRHPFVMNSFVDGLKQEPGTVPWRYTEFQIQDGSVVYARSCPLTDPDMARCICAVSDAPFDHIQINALNQGAKILSLKLQKEERATIRNVWLKRTVTDLLIRGAVTDPAFFRNIEADLLWGGGKQLCCIAVTCGGQGTDEGGTDDRITGYLISVAERLCGKRSYLLTLQNGHMFLFLPLKNRAAVDGFITSFKRYLAEYHSAPLTAHFAVSRIYRSIRELPAMYRDCLVATITGKLGDTVYYEDMGASGLLLSLMDDPHFLAYYDKTVRVLAEYDKEYNGSLTETLEMLFSCDLNRKHTAEALFIHVETLRYRLGKIEKLTGTSLDSAQDLLILQLCMGYYAICRSRGNDM